MRHGDIGLIVSTDAGFLELHKVYRESSNIILRYNSVPYRMINMRLWWGNRKYLTGAQSRNLAAPTALFIIITQEDLLQTNRRCFANPPPKHPLYNNNTAGPIFPIQFNYRAMMSVETEQAPTVWGAPLVGL